MKRVLQPTTFCLTILPILCIWYVSLFLLPLSTPPVLKYGLLLPLAYFLGSIPWGYFFLHWSQGIDIRQYGSGKTGMSNVLRTGGRKTATVVLILDISKGIVIVLIARHCIGTTAAEIVSGLLALIGHNWPIFLKFRGGRGIATGLGGLAVMAPIPALCAAVAFIPVTLVSKYVSLGSIVGVLTACLTLIGLTILGTYSIDYSWYSLIAGSIIIWQHRDNMKRIWDGTERKLGNHRTPHSNDLRQV